MTLQKQFMETPGTLNKRSLPRLAAGSSVDGNQDPEVVPVGIVQAQVAGDLKKPDESHETELQHPQLGDVCLTSPASPASGSWDPGLLDMSQNRGTLQKGGFP